MNTALQLVLNNLRQKKLTLGFAESCTGGLLSATLCHEPGVSDLYKGSVVCYANEVKEKLLGVLPLTLQKYGAVSEQTAAEMVKGCCKILSVDVAVSITGIAGPSGGTAGKPVGTVCFAVYGPGFEKTTTQHFTGPRKAIQEQAAEFALKFLSRVLEN